MTQLKKECLSQYGGSCLQSKDYKVEGVTRGRGYPGFPIKIETGEKGGGRGKKRNKLDRGVKRFAHGAETGLTLFLHP